MKLFRAFSCFNCGSKVDRDVEVVHSKAKIGKFHALCGVPEQFLNAIPLVPTKRLLTNAFPLLTAEATYTRHSEEIAAEYPTNQGKPVMEGSGSSQGPTAFTVEPIHSDTDSESQLSPAASITATRKLTPFNTNNREEEIQPVIEEEEQEEEQGNSKATIVAIASDYCTHLMSRDIKETLQAMKQASRPMIATAAMWLLIFLAFTTFVSMSLLSAIMSYIFNKEDPFAVDYTQLDDYKKEEEKAVVVVVKQEEKEEAPIIVDDTDDGFIKDGDDVLEHIHEELAQQA